MIDISVLIVNYNTAALVQQCIESVLRQVKVSFEVIVVDNHSQDESLARLQSFVPAVTLIANDTNHGFGKANNQAFRLCSGRYIFMLNPDARCLSELDLFHAVQYMETHTDCGLAGTRIVNQNNQVENTAFYTYPRQDETTVDFLRLPGKLATVLGASMLCRREVYEKVGGFDESFFLYGEETDLCLRIRQAGYRIGYCETVTVSHVGGASEKGSLPEDVVRKKKAGKLLFYRKHYGQDYVLKIVKRDFNHARFHVLRLQLMARIFRLGPKQQSKLQRHRATLELVREFLLSL